MKRNDWPTTCPHGRPSLLPTCALCMEKWIELERQYGAVPLQPAIEAFNAWYRAGADDSGDSLVIQTLYA